MTLRSSTPASVPAIEPDPPVSSVPPITTAAIAWSSRPTPIVDWPDEERAATSRPASPASSAAHEVHRRLHPGDRQPHQARRVLAAADRVTACPYRVRCQHDPADQRTRWRRCMTGTRIPRIEPWPSRVTARSAGDEEDRVALVGDGERQSRANSSVGEGDDERRHPGPGDQQAVGQPDQPADRQRQRDRHDAARTASRTRRARPTARAATRPTGRCRR